VSDKDKLLKQTLLTMFKLRRAVDHSFPVSPGETAVSMLRMQTLGHLKAHPGITIGQLARELHTSSPAATQLVERLVRAGLVERRADADDRRVSRLFLSTAGKRATDTFPPAVRRRMRKVFSDVPEEDLRQALRVFSKLLATITGAK
jgi:MarR family transcriptional regulator for hemolysin